MSSSDSLSPLSPGLMDAIDDPLALILWELLRLRRGGSAAELAGLSGRPLAVVHASLDRLLAAGLVAGRPAGRGRRAVTYRVTCPEIRVNLDDVTSAEADTITRRWHESRCELFTQITRRSETPRSAGQKRGFAMEWAYLTDADGLRISQLVREIFGIVVAAKDRHAATLAEGSSPPKEDQSSPYALLFQLMPVTEIPLPSATVVFARQPATRMNQLKADTQMRASLSQRERQVAEALAAGLSRPAVARQLGLSPHTVITLSQRIYAKFGIRSRAELARVMASRV